jgi:ABC-type phosphate transport system permease subunit
VNVLIATGLILFVITFVVNAVSRAVVGGRAAGKGI